MTNRFVRSSKFRHVFGTAYKKDNSYDGIKVTKSPHESNMSSVNIKFIAVVLESQGGGAFLVAPLSKVGYSCDYIGLSKWLLYRGDPLIEDDYNS